MEERSRTERALELKRMIAEREASGPPAQEFEEYAVESKQEYHALLASNPQEPSVQEFLERNPSFIPGGLTPGSTSGHAPLHGSVISQPVLPGFDARKPDFMWVSTHSEAWFPTLIEIERPGKRLYTSKGIPTADFTQARNQLAQWRTWFADPTNQQQFTDAYGIPRQWRTHRQPCLHMILIYGRRAEFEGSPTLSKHRGSLLSSPDEELISFDRLAPHRDLAYAAALRAKGSGVYGVLEVSPVFAFNETMIELARTADGLGEAIERNARIAPERKRFLLGELDYWLRHVSESD